MLVADSKKASEADGVNCFSYFTGVYSMLKADAARSLWPEGGLDAPEKSSSGSALLYWEEVLRARLPPPLIASRTLVALYFLPSILSSIVLPPVVPGTYICRPWNYAW